MISEKEAQKLKLKKDVDVLVVGGGPSGIIAAQAAAEDGLDVLLIDSRNFLGGNMTIGLPILGFLGQKGNQIIKGLPDKWIKRLREKDAASEHHGDPLHMSLTLVEPEAVKTEALSMLTESNVSLLLYTYCVETVVENNELKGVVVESKSGRERINAKVVIDCTGDADVAYRAGVSCEQGDEKGGTMPPTLMFCMAGVNTEKVRNSIVEEPRTYVTDFIPAEFYGQNKQFIVVGLRSLMDKARKNGLHLPTARTIFNTGLRKGEVWVNMAAILGVNAVDAESLTEGEIIGREQIKDIIKYLKTYVPGFEDAYFTKTAPFLGIRETRRIVGKYVMDKDDILNRRRFKDAVAVGSYPIDIHHPEDGDATLEWSGDCYDIPYRSLIPKKIENLIVAGRSISTTHEAMSSTRVMSHCMAMGEAAGRAAKLAVKQDMPPHRIDVSELQRELLDKGAYLNEEVREKLK